MRGRRAGFRGDSEHSEDAWREREADFFCRGMIFFHPPLGHEIGERMGDACLADFLEEGHHGAVERLWLLPVRRVPGLGHDHGRRLFDV